MSAMELNLLKERSQAAIQQKASRGELYLTVPAAYINWSVEPYKTFLVIQVIV
jgi:DNA invertase Pin-like site-specific DNA recombinase